MPSLESDKVDKALRGKMQAIRLPDTGDWYYVIADDHGNEIASTSISKGSKHSISPGRVSTMARQICLSNAGELVDLVNCTLSRADALKIMQTNCPPGTRRQVSARQANVQQRRG